MPQVIYGKESLLEACYNVSQLRLLEHLADQLYQMTPKILMNRAGEAAFKVILREWPTTKRITVLCGKGHNGGDGYVLARLAAQHHMHVQVFYMDELSDAAPLTQEVAKEAQEAGVSLKHIFTQTSFHFDSDIIVDALVGTGLRAHYPNHFSKIIHHINHSSSKILALDIPSGLLADTGKIAEIAINASVTITFLGLKSGFFMADGLQCTGRLYVDDLGIPPEIFKEVSPFAKRLSMMPLVSYLPPRIRQAHKGCFGHVLIVGGDYGMPGAVCLASEASLRTGAGRVSVATREKHTFIVVCRRPEIMAHPVKKVEDIESLLKTATVGVIGPGLGQSIWAKDLLLKMIKQKFPIVLDADALNLLAQDSTIRAHPHWILTPHPKEAARLLKCTVSDVETNRFESALELQNKYNGVIVLKGAGTLVIGPSKKFYICDAGNPGMATAGMGDVLSGIIGGLLAQNLDLESAAKVGVILHAKAGDQAAEKGERGMLASDLMRELRHYANP